MASPDGPESHSIPQGWDGEIVPVEGSVLKFGGPLPPPEQLRAYDQVRVGIAAEFVEQFKLEAAHRRAFENRIIDSDIQSRRDQVGLAKQGQWIAAMISIAALIAATILGVYGKEWLSAAFGAGGMSAVIRSVVARPSKSRPDPEDGPEAQ